MQRYDARLVRDACGNADVLMKEAHDGLFVRHADAMERERVLREAMERLRKDVQYWAENPRPDEWILKEWVSKIDAALAEGAKRNG